MPNPVVHWEIMARDLPKMQEFYTKLYNWKGMPFGTNYVLIDTGTTEGINGGILAAPPEAPAGTTFYVEVPDLEQYLKKAEDLGGRRCMPPTPIPGVGSFAMFTDLDGHCVGLFKGLGGGPSPRGTHGGFPVGWFEVAARDGKAAQKFYAKLFDWNMKVDEALGYGEVQASGPNTIGGGIMQAKDPNFTYVTFYTKVDDLAATLRKAESMGGKTMLESMPIPNVGTIAFFADPEGRPMGLFKLGAG